MATEPKATPFAVRRKAPLWPRLALLLGTSVLALSAAEAVCRWVLTDWLPPYPERRLWRDDELLGWSHRADQATRIRHSEYQISVRSNGDGLRDRDYPLARTPGKSRLLLLGDSFAWGLGVEEPNIFVELLERRHPGWEMINAGVSGYGTDQEYLYFRERGVRYRPDVVLLLLHRNDVRNNNSSDQYGRNKPRFRLREGALTLDHERVPDASAWQRLEHLLERSHFLGVLWQRIKHAPWPRSGKQRRRVEADFAVTAELLGALAREVRSKESLLLVVSVPMAESLRRQVAATLSELDVPYLPLDRAFEAARSRLLVGDLRDSARAIDESRKLRVNPFTYELDFHWNSLGHQVAAEAIEALMVDQGLLSKGETG